MAIPRVGGMPAGALADMLMRTYAPGAAVPVAMPEDMDPVQKLIAAGNFTTTNPATGQPYGTSSIQGEQAGTYMDPGSSQIGRADLGAAARGVKGGTAAPAAPGMPNRSDFPPGIVGQGQFNKAVMAWRAKAKV